MDCVYKNLSTITIPIVAGWAQAFSAPSKPDFGLPWAEACMETVINLGFSPEEQPQRLKPDIILPLPQG
jgi:hypothetical protein